jgi:hypothetical protein
MAFELPAQACGRRALRRSRAVAVGVAVVASVGRLCAVDPDLPLMAWRAVWPTMGGMESTSLGHVARIGTTAADALDVLHRLLAYAREAV